MTRTFEEVCAKRDPLYAATKPVGEFEDALDCDVYGAMLDKAGAEIAGDRERWERDGNLGILAIRALRNQGQPYYHV